jgi:glyoxylate reductase
MMKTILITRKIPENGVKMLCDKGYEVDVNAQASIPTQTELISMLSKKPYDAVLSLLTDKLDAKVFASAPSVKMYANYATGFDNIDLKEAAERGITVSNAPSDIASEAVAEHAIALMLALAARIVEADQFVRDGKYAGWDPMNFIGTDMLGKTLGLIGAGRIGGRVAHYARGLGQKVIYTDVKRNADIEKDSGAVYFNTSEEILKLADVVSLHVPLLESTRHLMNEARLKIMKPTAYLVNTSRGPVVDEKALEKVLKEKVIAGAALDVFEFEPQISPGLIGLDNVILTPHIASASIEAREDMARIAATNIIEFLEGRKPPNAVIGSQHQFT